MKRALVAGAVAIMTFATTCDTGLHAEMETRAEAFASRSVPTRSAVRHSAKRGAATASNRDGTSPKRSSPPIEA
ncbi:MAG: hypothetical protein JO197_17295 [Acidobacteria bacterium]|nr:hypothetical protein [Acidobacteriota bacterium]MBV9478420.1 hypothetical protein [Acidobacteriota bacterium]